MVRAMWSAAWMWLSLIPARLELLESCEQVGIAMELAAIELKLKLVAIELELLASVIELLVPVEPFGGRRELFVQLDLACVWTQCTLSQ
jgi:hypothetical protein